jgi:hypothetical protein
MSATNLYASTDLDAILSARDERIDSRLSGVFLVGVITGVAFSYTGMIGFVSGVVGGLFLKQQQPEWAMQLAETVAKKFTASVVHVRKAL